MTELPTEVSLAGGGDRALVTGASGFIASHLVRLLLESGYRVRGTVRGGTERYRHLWALPGAEKRLELVQADLLDPTAFAAAAPGNRFVFHVASPYRLEAKDPQRDLVDPAVQGTTNVLSGCQHAESVERVVITSSMAAITDEPDSDHVYTEADWNEKSTLDRNPYYLSKKMAEEAAWTFVERERPRFKLVAINPFLVIGPSLSDTINPSTELFRDLLTGVYPGIMRVAWGFVDVRDVALAHLRAAERRDAVGRYLCAARTVTMREVVEILHRHGYGQGWKLPRLDLDCTLGDFVVKVASYFQPKGVGTYLRTHIGRTPRFDNGKIRRELGIEFRDVETTVVETIADLERWRHLRRES